mgnify:FL=1
MVKFMYYYNIFFLFSILGHFIENFFYTSKDSGILFGYWTPIYGVGVVIILIIYKLISKFVKKEYLKVPLLFLCSSIILSISELFAGILIERLLKVTFWDYSKEKFSIFRYTSLKMALIWGLSSIVLIYLIMPVIDKFINYIPKSITYILITLFCCDFILSITPYLIN